MPEIRCNSKKHGEITEDAIGEFRRFCDSRFCKVRPNEITEHIWDLGKVSEDGIIRPIDTKHWKRPEVKGIDK